MEFMEIKEVDLAEVALLDSLKISSNESFQHEMQKILLPVLENLCKPNPELSCRASPKTKGINYLRNGALPPIKDKLKKNVYNEPWELVNDIWLIFKNAQERHKKKPQVFNHCKKLKEIFEREIDVAMKQLGYCCGQKLDFKPTKLPCCNKDQACTIPVGGIYYEFESNLEEDGLQEDRYNFCAKCFSNQEGDAVLLAEPTKQDLCLVPKTSFQKKSNDAVVPEPFIQCGVCERNLHSVCVLHNAQIWQEGFICDNCHKTCGTQRNSNSFTAASLSTDELSEHIENRVNTYLKKQNFNTNVGHVCIRTVYHEVKKINFTKRKTWFFNDPLVSFPLRLKSFYAFLDVGGIDVCFFGARVQECGPDVPSPYTRRAYLSFFDSVQFVTPKQLRADLYHEILLGYLGHCQKSGFEFVNIQARPSSEGEDYIFYRHPREQKIFKPEFLRDWFGKMLDKGKNEQIVLGYEIKTELSQTNSEQLGLQRHLPCFDENSWPAFVEKSFFTFSKQKSQEFFVVRLLSAEELELRDFISDSTPISAIDLMKCHHSFLRFARNKNYEFSSLRRAKWSTMGMLFQLHKERQDFDNNRKKLLDTECPCTTREYATGIAQKDEVYKLEMKLMELEKQNKEKDSVKISMKKDGKKSHKKIAELEKNLKEQDLKLDESERKAKEEMTKLKEDMDKLQAENQNYKEKIQQMQKDSDDKSMAMISKEEELKKSRKRIEELEKRSKQQYLKLRDEKETKLKEELKKVQKENENYKEKLQRMQQAIEKKTLNTTHHLSANVKGAKRDGGFLGRGGYGCVRIGYIDALGVVAIKCLKLTGSKEHIQEMHKKYMREIENTKLSSHVNVVRLEGFTDWPGAVGIIMEYMPGKSLSNLLFSKDDLGLDEFKIPNISPIVKLRFCVDFISGMTYLHHGCATDQRMVHGDLKPENLLLTAQLRCKISDFGGADFATCSATTTDNGAATASGHELTQLYAAPERLKDPVHRPSKAMDVFSASMIIRAILVRKLPCHVGELRMLTSGYINFICNGDRHPLVDIECLKEDLEEGDVVIIDLLKEEMKKCWNHTHQNRPSMMDVRDCLQDHLSKSDLSSIEKHILDIIHHMDIKQPSRKQYEWDPINSFHPPMFD